MILDQYRPPVTNLEKMSAHKFNTNAQPQMGAEILSRQMTASLPSDQPASSKPKIEDHDGVEGCPWAHPERHKTTGALRFLID